MSELEKVKSEYLTKLKKVKLVEAGTGIDEADNYIKYINGNNVEEIEQEAQTIVGDLNKKDGFGDVYNQRLEQSKNTWRPF